MREEKPNEPYLFPIQAVTKWRLLYSPLLLLFKVRWVAPPIPYLGMVYYPIIHPLSNHTFQEWVDDAQRQADPTYYEWTRKSSSFSGPITFPLFLIIQGNRFNHTLTVQPGEWSNAPLSHMIIADMPHLYLTGEYGIQLLPVAAGHRTNWSVFVRDKTNRWMGIRRDR